MRLIKKYAASFFQLLYPHSCCACGSDILEKNMLLCLRCFFKLPRTSFASFPGNPVEKIFFGRISVAAAHSELYFTKNELVQTMLHQLKYRGNKEIGHYLGTLTGDTLLRSSRFSNIDYIIPLPLHPSKEFKRGYNQADLIAEGIAESMMVPVMKKNVIRKYATATQTKKSRIDRWQNVSESFSIVHPDKLTGKNVLLVDDVITTGATLEACGKCILNTTGAGLYISTLAYANK